MMRLKNILVPTDFSQEAELATAWAVKLAKEETGSTIYLLNVIRPLPYVGVDLGLLADCDRNYAKDKLEECRRKIPPPLTSVGLLECGDAATLIRSACVDKNIDLVVMTTHGRHGLPRVVHPNLTEQIVREAPCPVMVLHLQKRSAEILKSAQGGDHAN